MNSNEAKLILNYMNAPMTTEYTYQMYRINGFQSLDHENIKIDLVNLANEKRDNVKIDLSDQRHLLQIFKHLWGQIGHSSVNASGQTIMQIDLSDLIGQALLVVSEDCRINKVESITNLVSVIVLDRLGIKLLLE